jgi:DNA topoisomerase IB
MAGTVLAAIALGTQGTSQTKKQAMAKVKTAICAVAQLLGNTPAICRKCYVHPAVVEACLGGTQIAGLNRIVKRRDRVNLRAAERGVVKFLRMQVRTRHTRHGLETSEAWHACSFDAELLGTIRSSRSSVFQFSNSWHDSCHYV